ncbi:MG2 domain-containing protein [uncultured Mucilaginibacter sp.]|uniref:carboxypeptidase-like regulatory domain-containing protein n=1 Tax=uncultured Mucilaginibacter sp. TaxID=797541 RepID=UPI0025F5F3A3|nr:MG2 domain-containing protein [uncultured Mucilaginibacter sp.]
MKTLILVVVCAFLCITILPAHAQTAPAQKPIKLFFEKVYLHTDRQVYTQGDDVWFKAYLVNAQDNHLISTSKSLYTELISPTGNKVNQEMVLMKDGLGIADFNLSASLEAGTYRLRAYTNWMRNFGDNFIFEKKLTIVSSQAATVLSKPIPPAVIRFFPEGGSLVTGVTSVIAVKAETATGDGVAARGAVYSASGDTVAHYTTDSLGMGMFTLLPVAGQTYQSKTALSGAQLVTALPQPLNNGLSLKIYRQDTSVYAVVACNDQLVSQLAGQNLSLKIRSFGRVTYQQTFQLKSNTAAVQIPVSQLPGGIAAVTLYDVTQKPNCERLLYIEPRDKTSIAISLDKASFAPREKVTLNISVTGNNGQPVKGNFSVSAVDANLSPADDSNIMSYLTLQSELKGNIKNAARYFDSSNPQRAKQLDLLLLTQGWRDFIWKRLADTTLRIAYIPEQGISLTGLVSDSKHAPIPNANVTLIANAANGRLFGAQTDAKGRYFFDNLLLTGRQRLNLTSKNLKGKATGTLSLDSLTNNYAPVSPSVPYVYVTKPQFNELNTASLVKQVAMARQRSLSDTLIRLKDVEVRTPARRQFTDRTVTTFGYKDEVLDVTPADSTYNSLKNYILAKSNQARTSADGNGIAFVSDGRLTPPRIVVDNRDIVFSDNDASDVINQMSNHYFEMPMSAVKRVVIKKLVGGPSLLVQNNEGFAATSAAASASGRASQSRSDMPIMYAIYLTLNPDGINKLKVGATQAEVNGYYEARTFYSPSYEKPQPADKTDARPTLYWLADGKTDAAGRSTVSYYNSDIKTKVRIVIQGISNNGFPLFYTKTYNTK